MLRRAEIPAARSCRGKSGRPAIRIGLQLSLDGFIVDHPKGSFQTVPACPCHLGREIRLSMVYVMRRPSSTPFKGAASILHPALSPVRVNLCPPSIPFASLDGMRSAAVASATLPGPGPNCFSDVGTRFSHDQYWTAAALIDSNCLSAVLCTFGSVVGSRLSWHKAVPIKAKSKSIPLWRIRDTS